jgi:cytochrome P450
VTTLVEPEIRAQAQAPAVGEAPESPAGPVEATEPIRFPPGDQLPAWAQTVRFMRRPLSFHVGARRRYGDVWQMRILSRREPFAVTSHPDHFRSLVTAKAGDAPSLTGDSPLRPILGPDSVLTSTGARHLRQRKLLLPPFHGEAVQRYARMISEIAEREIDQWPLGEPFALAPRMQVLTLEVIMNAVFGIEGQPAPGSREDSFQQTVKRFLTVSTRPAFALVELQNAARAEPRGVLRRMMEAIDRQLLAMIAERRAAYAPNGESGPIDVLSLLLEARDEQGEPLTDRELRDELLSLVLAGHETTANSLAWIFERLLRTPEPYERLRELVRAGGADADEYVEATIHEGMRNRPVVPMIVRRVQRPWRFGQYVVAAGTPVAVSIVALHHRADVYPQPFAFAPGRFLAAKPGTYTWIPFGGGIRRCLGASLAMAEQRVVLAAIARRTDLRAPDSAPEHARQRNVTTIPDRGAQVVVTYRRPA